MYTYNNLMIDMGHWRRMGARVSNIGSTALGVEIPCVHIGDDSKNQIIVQGAIHAREYITAELMARQIYHAIARYGTTFEGGIYFVPMVNIDGVNLCQFGLRVIPEERRAFLREVNGGNSNFTLWKANINAVDLNTNFDARWGTGTQNIRQPAPSNYIGPYPNSETETRALVDFTNRVNPSLTISYHARGNIIFWDFFQQGEQRVRDRRIGEQLSALTTYPLIEGAQGSAGGYKDWCIEKRNIPAYTIEIIEGSVPFPIPSAALAHEWENNKDVPRRALEYVRPYIT